MKKPAPKKKVNRRTPISKAEARNRLATIGDRLSAYISQDPFPSEHVIFAERAIRELLEGKHPSLDHALGLVNPVGKPKQPPGKHIALAKEVFYRREGEPLLKNCKPMTWGRICEELKFTDERKLRAIYERNLPHVVKYFSDKLTAKLSARDDKLEEKV